MKQTFLALPLLVTSLFGIAGSAEADILKAATFSLDASGGSRLALPLTNAGAQSTNFTIPGAAPRRVAITYSAHCGAEGPAAGFISIDIVVDGITIPPTTTNADPFCSANDTNAIDQLVRATVIGVKLLNPGQHTVEVFAQPVGGATNFQIGRATLLIQD